MFVNRVIERRTGRISATLELRKGEVIAARKKLIGWGARILEGRTAMLRKAGAKMTQGELGQAVGVSAQQISRYEAETDEPGYETWIRLAKALQMSPSALLFGNTHVPIEEGVEVPVERPSQRKKKA